MDGIEVTGIDGLNRKVNELQAVVQDLRPMFEQFSSDFYKNEKAIFQLKGPGQFVDLSDDYALQKERKYGFTYPILFASGRLAASLLSRRSVGSVNVIEADHFIIGTSVTYGFYHHSEKPRKGPLPRRPLWDENPDSPMFHRWARIADRYLQKAADGALK